jgi:UDPglucose 6-dehydrogenase
MKTKKLIFCGISHLSLNYGATAAKFNYKVCFFDNNKNVDDFLKNKNKFDEPRLNQYLKKNKKNISFISKLPTKLSDVMLFIAIDIKTSIKNISDYKRVNNMINILNKNISKKNVPLIIMSQVSPKFTRNIKWPKNLLYYQVETLIFGEAINRAENPERIIVGTYNGLRPRNKKYQYYLDLFKTDLIYMKYEEAELTKMFINSYLVANVTLTNNLATICKKLNLDWKKPKEALSLDRRIGKYAYLEPGLGISGGNLERDIINLSNLNKQLKINTQLFKVFIEESKKQKTWIISKLNFLIKKKLINQNSLIGIYGLTYKEKTNSIKNSPSIFLLNKLKKYKVYCYDKILFKNKYEKINIKWIEEEKIFNICDLIFIMHKDKKLNKIINKNSFNNSELKVIDPFNVLNIQTRKKLKYYVSL